MRTQYCREHIDQVAENCGLEKKTVDEVKRVADFCDQHSEISELSTHAIMPLIRERNDKVREKAILKCSERLKGEVGAGRGNTKKLTEKDVRAIVFKAMDEVKQEEIEQLEKERSEREAKIIQDQVDKVLSDPTISKQLTIEPGVQPIIIPIQQTNSTSKFNQTNDNIEWARWSWNPVTGCKHDCKYCYARDIATRFFKEGFTPTFRPERLSAPKNTIVPNTEDIGLHNVFVCSMADLFGAWVPQEWIDAVLKSVRENPQWTFLFLTKNPSRLVGINFPKNSWVGTTVDIQKRVAPAEEAFKKIKAPVKFLSCEPLLEKLTFKDMSMFDWIIIGGRSGSTGMPEGQPEWGWVEILMEKARRSGLSIYFKPNLTVRPKEYPKVK
jgi:protein gp37